MHGITEPNGGGHGIKGIRPAGVGDGGAVKSHFREPGGGGRGAAAKGPDPLKREIVNAVYGADGLQTFVVGMKAPQNRNKGGMPVIMKA